MKSEKYEQSQIVKPHLQPQQEVADEALLSATTFDAILERMKAATGASSDTGLAKILSLRQSSISGAKERQSIPPAWAVQIAQNYGVSLDWLIFGKGEMRQNMAQEGLTHDQSEKTIYNGKETLTCTNCEVTMIPMVEARLSAGSGSWETSSSSDRRYAFRTDFLRRKGNTQAMVLMRVAGDSMEPEVKDNDVVLIDTSNTMPFPGRLYAVAVQELVYLKMVNATPSKLVLTSANPAYGPMEIDARGDLQNGIRIIGKAVWVGRELD